MQLKTYILTLLAFVSFSVSGQKLYDMKSFGIAPGSKKDMAGKMDKALSKIRSEAVKGEKTVLSFSKGVYHFYPEKATERIYFISNHDQDNPKKVGLAIEDFENLTIEGNGAEFVFHGRMIPVSLMRSVNCTLKNFSIDFETPHITQMKVVASDSEKGITFELAPWVNYRIGRDSVFKAYGRDWELTPEWGVAFEPDTKHLIYNAGDMDCIVNKVYRIGDNILQAPNWKDSLLVPGTIFAMRGWGRPAPGIFMSHDVNTSLFGVKVHYAEGMGLLAQLCENITLDGFGVCLKGEGDPRYFTTQADATHFSGCKGKITSVNGLYEGMMDDAINVHGTYLKVMKRLDNKTLLARYMHEQSWGFDWGFTGDTVQFIRSKTMELLDGVNVISKITPVNVEENGGLCEFEISFENSLPSDFVLTDDDAFGIENLTWTPEVYFARNVIRNNRARGALFSTPRKTIVENNLFDHTSGTAILLCGDCNGWYETGACRDVVIRNNKFVNALTSMYQFTNAVISIYPEIPDLDCQVKFFHGGKPGGNTDN